jgi:glycosyltransferase involved in cell wall biosynthesis
MKIFAHNFNPQSNSGPNKFTRQLFSTMQKDLGVSYTINQQDADVEFCLIQQVVHKVKPMVLRLDGIWFNSEQNYKEQNKIIEFSYSNADAVVFQSNFNKKLTEAWFGSHKNSHVIHNSADMKQIERANAAFWNNIFGKETEVWSCASSWRPHKRLSENIRYFMEFAPKNAILAVAGKGAASERLNHRFNQRIKFLDELDYMSLLSLYKRSSTFVHLAYLDHCPNVVVDAQATGCRIICSSTGGTHEVVDNGIMILEDEWDFKPCTLYKPPQLDFSKIQEIAVHRDFRDKKTNKKVSRFAKCVNAYYDIMKGII